MKNKFSKKIISDPDAYYMSCPEKVAIHLAKELEKFDSAVELCCAVGITSIQLAKKIKKVFGVDIDSKRINYAKKNAKIYGANNTEFINGNVLDKNLLKKIKADVAILDPDWSEKNKLKSIHSIYPEKTQPNWRELFELTSGFITKNIVSRIPKEWGFELLNQYGPCRIEKIIWDGKIKFKIVYFGEEIKENSEREVIFD